MARATASPFEAPSRREIRRLLERRARVAEERLGHIHESLTFEQSELFSLLPLLLHINHPSLPGFNGSDTPAGIAGYEPDRNALLSARRHARSLRHQRRPQRVPPILGLYLMGSSGTLGQDRQSDFDVWICHHPDLEPAQIEALQGKARLIEERAAALSMQLHFFVLHAEGFREGQNIALSDESSGSTQHHLLLEEFYRTGLLLAGRPPLWWIVPPEHLPRYRSYCDTLLRQRFVKTNDWLDFGGLEEVRLGEFFSAAHWQLFKGIQLPYKSLLKLLLFEAFASEFPRIHWFAEQAQAIYHGEDELSAADVDPYLLMMRRIESHLKKLGQPERLRLARRAMYLKSGVRLSSSQENWKTVMVRRLCEEWGWDSGELINLDRHREWKLGEVMEERNLLMAELSRSYRLLTALAREHGPVDQLDMHELSLLGRKLFAALDRRPGKIDFVNPGLSDNLHEDEIWLRRHPDTGAWQCHLSPPEHDSAPAKAATSVTELLLWLSANGVIDQRTRFNFPPGDDASPDQEHLRILRALQQHFPPAQSLDASITAYARPAHGRQALLIANALQPIRSHPDGLLTVSQRADPLSFGSLRSNLVASIDYIHSNSWGELHVNHQAGSSGLLDVLCQHLNLFFAQAPDMRLDCYCDTPGHGAAISARLGQLSHRIQAHFQHHGLASRYVLQIGEEFHVLTHKREHFTHHPLGDRRDLLEFLGESDGDFHATEIDAADLEGDLLPLVMRLNRPGRIQVCFTIEQQGIHSLVLDTTGSLIEQWHPHAGEGHFLAHLQRFFDTLRDWHQPLRENDASPSVEYLRLYRHRDRWEVQTVQPAVTNRPEYTELILSTGPAGPWSDGFSLLSGEREFNSVELGERIYAEAAAHVLEQRRNRAPYPLYLTGVLSTGSRGEPDLSLADLLRFKARIEQRLNARAFPSNTGS